MKKFISLLVIVCSLFLITGCSNNVKTIGYDELSDLIKNKETFILEVSQDGCSHCAEYKPIFEDVLKENKLKAYNLNITYISEEDYNKFDKKYEFEGTPTTMFFKDGKEVLSSRIVGTTSKTKLTNSLKRLGYIKEK